MKKAFKVFLKEDEFDSYKNVEITCEHCDSDNGSEHTIIGYVDENNWLYLEVSHETYEDDGCYAVTGEFKEFYTIVKVPLDELM